MAGADLYSGGLRLCQSAFWDWDQKGTCTHEAPQGHQQGKSPRTMAMLPTPLLRLVLQTRNRWLKSKPIRPTKTQMQLYCSVRWCIQKHTCTCMSDATDFLVTSLESAPPGL